MAVPADRESRWAELRRLKQGGDWQGALSLCAELHDPLLLWLRPSLDFLHFLGGELRARGVSAVLSIGCGSGLFEWLLASATGLRVTGVEVNREWWESKYSPPTFLPLLYQDDLGHALPADDEDNKGRSKSGAHSPCPKSPDWPDALEGLLKHPDVALLFCYFNDMAAFLEYVERFHGGYLVVAGPGPDAPAHCQPQPFSDAIPPCWGLTQSARIGCTWDWVAIYSRRDTPGARDSGRRQSGS